MARFDANEKRVHQAASGLFGESSIWRIYPALVLFRAVTEKEMGYLERRNMYMPTVEIAEYYEGDFPQLKEIVDSGNTTETITINGKDYIVRAAEKRWDGDTFIAFLEIVIS